MKVSIGTTSDLKVRALKDALYKLDIDSEIIALKTNSGVSDQPFGYKEINEGARNRAREVLENTTSDIAVGIESGLINIEDDYYDIACICVVTKEGEESVSYSAGYFTPQWIIEEIKEKNTEYGHITQRLSGDTEKDPLKYFSGGITKREELLSQAIMLAFTKIINKDKYEEKSK